MEIRPAAASVSEAPRRNVLRADARARSAAVTMRRVILLPLLSLAVMAAEPNEEQEKFDGF